MAKRTKKLIDNSYTDDDAVRLNKYLSDAGVCSRREADKFIEAGEVTVDGITATMGTKVSKEQKVIFQGVQVSKDELLVLIAFNKPKGIVCTTDKGEKNNIIDYIDYGKRIYPIGRLDKDSEGLILLTNDGNIVNKILRAGNSHEKEYIVTVNKPITSDFLKGMAAGVPILDTVTRPCEIKALDKDTFQIILTQGLNRQIRRMCEYFDFKVLTLQRIRIMNVCLGHMQLGGFRNVTEKEIAGLNELMSNSINNPEVTRNSMEENTEVKKVSQTSRTEQNVKSTRNYKTATSNKSRSGGQSYKDYKLKSTSYGKSDRFAKSEKSNSIDSKEKSNEPTKSTSYGNSDRSGKPVERTSYGKSNRFEKPERSTSYGNKEKSYGPTKSTSYGNSDRSGKPAERTSYGKSDRFEKPERSTAYGNKEKRKGRQLQILGIDEKNVLLKIF